MRDSNHTNCQNMVITVGQKKGFENKFYPLSTAKTMPQWQSGVY
jgi:hypothetical protein